MTTPQIKALSDADLRAKYFSKKEKVRKLYGCKMGSKKQIVWKMLPGNVSASLGGLKDEFDQRYEWNDDLKRYQRKPLEKKR